MVVRNIMCIAFVLTLASRSVFGDGGLNPANPGLPKASYGTDNVPNNGASAMCVDCHTVAPVVGRGSHFVHQTSRTTSSADQTAKERLLAWSTTTALSKYGNFVASPPISVTGVKGEIICESCHNIILNRKGGNNLVESSFNSDLRPAQPNQIDSSTTTLCEGCHVTASLPGHHPMTGDTTSNGTILSNSDPTSAFTRLFIDNTNPVPAGSTSEVIYPGANKVNCISCHGNGHTGYTNTGARILRRGWAGPASITPIDYKTGVVGAATDGAQRQFDKDPSGVIRLVPNWQPLCDACHTLDD